jgi:hypothetical protein
MARAGASRLKSANWRLSLFYATANNSLFRLSFPHDGGRDMRRDEHREILGLEFTLQRPGSEDASRIAA